MVGASYAAVPLYNWFCRVTGFNGTTQVATVGAAGRAARRAPSRCASIPTSTAAALALRAGDHRDRGPDRRGDHRLLQGDQPAPRTRPPAQASYNVTPLTVGAYFQKINCFCFTEQTLGPGETREMPVVFYVDPAIAADRDNDDAQHHHAVLHLLSAAQCRAEAAGGERGRAAAGSALNRTLRATNALTRRAAGVNRPAKGETDNGYGARQASRLPSRRSEPVAGRRLALGLRHGGRRGRLDAPDVSRRGLSCSAPASSACSTPWRRGGPT